jgi:hypothetical protein
MLAPQHESGRFYSLTLRCPAICGASKGGGLRLSRLSSHFLGLLDGFFDGADHVEG